MPSRLSMDEAFLVSDTENHRSLPRSADGRGGSADSAPVRQLLVSGWYHNWLAGTGVLILLALIGYGHLLTPGKIPYSPYSDITSYHLAAKTVLHRAFQGGRGLAFWRADQLSGTPAFTNPNILATHPLHLLFYMVSPIKAMGWTIWLHLLAGACVAFFAATVVGLDGFPRLFVAIATLFNFKVIMAVYAGWLSMLPSIALFPLLFATVLRLAQRPGPRTALAAAASGALCLQGGLLQLTYYSGWFLIAYLVTALGTLWRRGEYVLLRRILGWVAASGILALGLSAYVLLPLAADAPLITRGAGSYEFFQAGHALGPSHLLTLLWPEALGTSLNGSYPGAEMWEDVAYFGLIPLVLAAATPLLAWQRPLTRPLAVGFLASALVALETPLHPVLHALLPGFHLFRLPGRLLFLTAFFGILLAGISLAEIQARLFKRRGVGWPGGLMAALAILFVAGEGMTYARRYIHMADTATILPRPEYARFLNGDQTLFRVAPVGRMTVNDGWAAPLGLQLITGYEPFNLLHYQNYMQLMQMGEIGDTGAVVWTDFRGMSRWDLLDGLNAKYILSLSPLPLPVDRVELVARFPDQPVFRFYEGFRRGEVFVYRNRLALPRAFWATRVLSVRGGEEMRAVVQTTALTAVAVVQVDDKPLDCGDSAGGSRSAVVDVADGYLAIETDSLSPGFLVISEVWHPGWRALLDGRRLSLHKTNLALMGVCIPAGRHRLVLEYRPLFWTWGLGVSMASAGVLLTGLLLVSVRVWRKSLRDLEGASSGTPRSR